MNKNEDRLGVIKSNLENNPEQYCSKILLNTSDLIKECKKSDNLQFIIDDNINKENLKLKKEILELKEILKQQKEKYKQIIEIIINNYDINTKIKYLNTKERLYEAISNLDVNLVNELTKDKVIIDGIIYTLDKKNKEANILNYCSHSCPRYINIPRSIIYESNEYKITKIIENSFKMANF